MKLITMLIEQIVLDVIEPGSAPGTRERTHHQINSREEENFIEERPEEEDIIIAVSYTHLDVYKRQSVNREKLLKCIKKRGANWFRYMLRSYMLYVKTLLEYDTRETEGRRKRGKTKDNHY